MRSLTRVFVLAQVRLYRDGLAQVLDAADGLEVVGAAGDWRDAGDAVAAATPDVLLLDTSMRDSVAAVAALHELSPGVRVVALGVPDAEREVVTFAEAGVAGYVTREESLDDLRAAIESVARGEMLCSPRLAATLLRRVAALAGDARDTPGVRLTPRELEVVDLIDEGLSNKAIATQLCIEVPTVKNHVHNILEKLQVPTRAAAAAHVRANGHRHPSRAGTSPTV